MYWFGEPLDRHSLNLAWADKNSRLASSNEPATSGAQGHHCFFWAEWRHYYADNDLAAPQAILKHHVVIDTNVVAYTRGVRLGMRKHQVRALAPDCIIDAWEANPQRAEVWWQRCLPYSGRIQPFDEHKIAIDLSGHPKPLDLAEKLADDLAQLKLGALQWGCAPSVWIAQLCAIHGQGSLGYINPNAALENLPVEALLPISQEHRARLRFLGYRRIADVARLSVDVLKKQFGVEAPVILQAAQGKWCDEVQAVFPRDTLRETLCFPDPIHDALLVDATLARIALRLSPRLSGLQSGVIALEIEADGGAVHVFTRKLKRPLWDRAGVYLTLRTLFATYVPNEQGITRVAVELSDLATAKSKQKSLETVIAKNRPDDALYALESALGSGAVMLAKDVKLERRQLVLREWRRATGWN